MSARLSVSSPRPAAEPRRRTSALAPAAFLGAVLPFAALAEEVAERDGFSWDRPVMLAVHHHSDAAVEFVMRIFTQLGSVYGTAPLLVLVVGLLARVGRRHEALLVTVALVAALTANNLLKLWFQRPRPNLWRGHDIAAGYSFPSGHSMDSMAFALSVLVVAWPTVWRRAVLVAAPLFTLFVGLSRIELGVHYPSDVLAGWLGGVACVALVWSLAGLARRRPAPRRAGRSLDAGFG